MRPVAGISSSFAGKAEFLLFVINKTKIHKKGKKWFKKSENQYLYLVE